MFNGRQTTRLNVTDGDLNVKVIGRQESSVQFINSIQAVK